ncbi:hypothetical protein [Acidithiobacillus marinus]|uniref:hypothetical protein n=1 Tax=Acidithiobacillus marinus TaxID=187490 RepID=UPI001179EEC6|nr:hypothetical protein [Acidithiobacillus marinus]
MIRVRSKILVLHTVGVSFAAWLAWILANPITSFIPLFGADIFRAAVIGMLFLYWLYEGWTIVSGTHKAVKYFERR